MNVLLVAVTAAASVCIGCGERVRRHTFIFENGFVGQFVVKEGADNLAPLAEDGSGKVLKIGPSGVLEVRPSDFAALSGWAEDTFRYQNGTQLETYIPHSQVRVSGRIYVTMIGVSATFGANGQVEPYELKGVVEVAP